MNSTSETGQSRYWVREHGVHVRSGPGLQQPILTQLARGQAVEATADPAILADGYHWLPIRQGANTAFVAPRTAVPASRAPGSGGARARGPGAGDGRQGTPLAAHTRALMAIAICESGARTARDNGGELVYRFEPLQWDRLFRTLGGSRRPPGPRRSVTSPRGGWGRLWAGPMPPSAVPMRWPSAPGYREDPAHEYAALVGFCLAKPGVAEALQTESWEQLWRLYKRGSSPVAAPFPRRPGARGGGRIRAGSSCAAGRDVGRPRGEHGPGRPVPGGTPARCRAGRGRFLPGFRPGPPASPVRLTHQAVTVVRPALQGLRYEGSRLVRRGLMLVTLVFTLWQTNVISPAQIVDLLEEAVVPLVTDQTDSVEGRLGHSLDALEARPGRPGTGSAAEHRAVIVQGSRSRACRPPILLWSRPLPGAHRDPASDTCAYPGGPPRPWS